MHRAHQLDGARLEQRGTEPEQRLVEAPEVTRRTPHRRARLRLGDVPGLVVQLVDPVGHHAQAAVVLHHREAVPLPRHRHQAVAELRLPFGVRRPTTTSRGAERREDLVAQVGLDRPAVDGFDDRAEHLPAGHRVVAGPGAGLPGRRGRGDPRQHLLGREVGVEVAAAVHREPTGVDRARGGSCSAPCRCPSRRRSRRSGRRARGGPAPRAAGRRRW